MVHHFGIHLPSWIDWGPIAPNIFFLLSGYLITLSLMKMQAKPKTGQVANFHIRRLVRLLPALYVMLAIGWLTGLSEFREGWLWHISFLTNVQMTIQNDWVGYASHLWSLSIQEQFYLLWPLLLFLPTRWLLPALLTTIVGATAFRITCLSIGTTEFFRWFLLPGSLDAFAAGGLVAWISRTRKDGVIIPPNWRWVFLASLLAAWITARTIRKDYGTGQISLAFIDTLETLVFSGLLIEFLQYQNSRLSKAFSNKTLCFIGKISYGLYLWHMLVALAITPILNNIGWEAHTHPFLRAAALISASTLTAWLSWILIEQPSVELGNKLTTGNLGIPRKIKEMVSATKGAIHQITIQKTTPTSNILRPNMRPLLTGLAIMGLLLAFNSQTETNQEELSVKSTIEIYETPDIDIEEYQEAHFQEGRQELNPTI